MSKIKYANTYNIARIIGGNIFKLIYKPLILNAKNIPNDGPIIICCNHEHIFDQYPITCATKRYVRWVAKAEYAKNPFYKLVGCIFVKRQMKDEYGNVRKFDNSEANNEVIDTLKKGGAVGIFPEGTRNRLLIARRNLREINEMIEKLSKSYDDKESIKSELAMYRRNAEIELSEALKDMDNRNIKAPSGEDLLPFKMGAINYAKETGATIVPTAVTGLEKNKFIGNLLPKKRLIVSFGTPFKVDNMDSNEALQYLQNEIKNLKEEHGKVKIKK